VTEEDEICGVGSGGEFHLLAEFVVGLMKMEMLVLHAVAVGFVSEAKEGRIGIIFLAATMVANAGNALLHFLKTVKSLAAEVEIDAFEKFEGAFPDVEKVQNVLMLAMRGFELLA
jgi:uncharacterized membrane protein